jgi:acetyl-CoA carboxylase carboxyl transferase subunit alpha
MKFEELNFERKIDDLEKYIDDLKRFGRQNKIDLSKSIDQLEKDLKHIKKKTFSNLSRWQKVHLSRNMDRPQSESYISKLISNRIELKNDRIFGDDKAITGGLGWLGDLPVVYLGQIRGKTTDERIITNFGYMHPDGYRKALRLMKLAEKFGRPVISFVDTPGAHPGEKSEERGQANAIADNLYHMSQLRTPFVVVIIGQGGSGGALGVAVGDRVLMLGYSIYCVCPPEACSGIIWKDHGEHASVAAEGLKPTAEDLYRFGIVDEIIPEPLGGAHRDPDLVIGRVGRAIRKHLRDLMEYDTDELLKLRYEKYRKIGVFESDSSNPASSP